VGGGAEEDTLREGPFRLGVAIAWLCSTRLLARCCYPSSSVAENSVVHQLMPGTIIYVAIYWAIRTMSRCSDSLYHYTLSPAPCIMITSSKSCHRREDGTRTSVSCLHHSALAPPYDVSCPHAGLCHEVAASEPTALSHYSSSSM